MLRLPASVRPRFVTFTGRTALGSLVAPRRGEPACLGPGLGHPGAHRDHDAERTGPPRFLGVPDARMPRSWTPVESPRLALITPRRCGLPLL